MKGQKQIFSTGKDDWGTPPALIEALQTRFCRKFGLDVAASKENKICKEFYSEEDNALTKFWGWNGTAWCNPPSGSTQARAEDNIAQAFRKLAGYTASMPANDFEPGGGPRLHGQDFSSHAVIVS